MMTLLGSLTTKTCHMSTRGMNVELVGEHHVASLISAGLEIENVLLCSHRLRGLDTGRLQLLFGEAASYT
jgi:hypothetical protein